MEYTFRRAVREKIPDIYGLAGPSKSGKTYSAHRMAIGLANGGVIAMINTEGLRGHRYADRFTYEALNLTEPFTTKKYKEAIGAARTLNPAVLIIDSMSHAHEGIGGMLDQHNAILDRMAGADYDKRHKMTMAAWAEPKQDEAMMINAMLQMDCYIILCFRAKEKLKLVKGKDPEPLGWQPIASDRIHYETAFTLILPPGSKGVPDMTAIGSELREPYDKMVTEKTIDEDLGRKLAKWAEGVDINALKEEIAVWSFEMEERKKEDVQYDEITGGKYTSPHDIQREAHVLTLHGKLETMRREKPGTMESKTIETGATVAP